MGLVVSYNFDGGVVRQIGFPTNREKKESPDTQSIIILNSLAFVSYLYFGVQNIVFDTQQFSFAYY